VHGAVVLDIQPGGMLLHAPKIQVAGSLVHYYGVGYGQKGEAEKLDAQDPVALLGFVGAKQTAVDKTTTPYLGPRVMNSGGDFCAMVTPLPTALTPYRLLRKDKMCGDFFPGVSDFNSLVSLPLVLRADFDLQTGEVARLIGAKHWDDDGATNPLIVHLRAEPDKPANIMHDAFAAISATVNTKIKLSPYYAISAAKYNDKEERIYLEVEADSDDGGVEIACSRDPKSLANTRHLGKAKIASRPANCVSIVVNNSGH